MLPYASKAVGPPTAHVEEKPLFRQEQPARLAIDSSSALMWDLFCLALLARLVPIVLVPAEPVWDGFYYDLGARRIALGLGYSEQLLVSAPDGSELRAWVPWAHYPVGYPLVLAALHWLFGRGPLVSPLFNAVTGAALTAVVYQLGRLAFPKAPKRALVAALVVAFHPGLILYAGALMTEPLAALLLLSSLLCLLSVNPAQRKQHLVNDLVKLCGAGALLGFATLVRPNAVLAAPVLAFAFALCAAQTTQRKDSGLRPRLRAWLVRLGKACFATLAIGSVALLSVLPWTLRNCRVMDACTMVSTNAGWNLVIGAAPGATGKFEFLVGRRPEGAPACDQGGQVAQDRCWFAYGARLIAADVPRWLALVPKKLHFVLDSEWFPINFLREARPDAVSARTHVALGRVLTWFHGLLLLLAALASVGLPAAWRRGTARAERPVDKAASQALPLVAQLGALALCAGAVFWGFDARGPALWPLGIIACVVPLLPLPGAPTRSAVELGACGLVVTTLITHAVFFGEDRYHLVISPMFALLAAGAFRVSRTA